MANLTIEQINEIRSKVMGAAAKVPGTLIGIGILLIILGMIGIAGQTLFSLVSVNVLGIFLFAGGVLPSLTGISKTVDNKFIIEDVHNFGPDYDLTLMQWHKNINAKWHEIPSYDLRFQRMWNFYLLASAAAFRARNIQLLQVVFRNLHSPGTYSGIR